MQGIPRIAGTRVHHEPRGLVDHQKLGIGKGHLQPHRVGGDFPHRREARLDAHDLLAMHEVARAGQPSVHRNRTGADPPLQARAAILRQHPGERRIEAQSRKSGRQRKLMGAELRAVLGGPSPGRGIRYTSAAWWNRNQ